MSLRRNLRVYESAIEGGEKNAAFERRGDIFEKLHSAMPIPVPVPSVMSPRRMDEAKFVLCVRSEPITPAAAAVFSQSENSVVVSSLNQPTLKATTDDTKPRQMFHFSLCYAPPRSLRSFSFSSSRAFSSSPRGIRGCAYSCRSPPP